MKKKILLSVFVLLLLAATSICIYIFDDYSHRNNIIFYGGTILTMDDKTPIVEAMFIKDGKIEALGNQDQIFKPFDNYSVKKNLEAIIAKKA